MDNIRISAALLAEHRQFRPRNGLVTGAARLDIKLADLTIGVKRIAKDALRTGVCQSYSGEGFYIYRTLSRDFNLPWAAVSTQGRTLAVHRKDYPNDFLQGLDAANRMGLQVKRKNVPSWVYEHTRKPILPNKGGSIWASPYLGGVKTTRAVYAATIGCPDLWAREEAMAFLESGGILRAEVTY